MEREARIISVNGEAVGWLSVRLTPAALELQHLYLIPTYQGNGIGTHVAGLVVAESARSGLPLRLSTAKINPARRLYERLGFVIVREDEHKVHMEMPST